MSDLSQARDDLAQVLTGVTVTVPGFPTAVAVPVGPNVSEEATAPLIMTGPADPYVDFDDVDFGEKRIRLVAVAVAEGANDDAADQVDDMINACLLKLLPQDSGFDVDQVDRPGKITLNGQSHLGVVIRVSRVASLGL